MTAKQHIFRVRRNYNRWVANQTLEDYALRFTAKSARRWSASRVAVTALGGISFLALEAIGATATMHYGFIHALAAILTVSLIIFLSGIPISYYAAKYGVDIDLLTRGAGFGYIGSTITSLIYASFTFIFFALEAAIMAMALDQLFAIPLAIGYFISAVVVIPLVIYGITFISRFQIWTQPIWLTLQLLPFIFIIYADASSVSDWTQFVSPEQSNAGFDIVMFGSAAAIMFALIAQIGEQVDFLRFIPEPKNNKKSRRKWWFATLAAGPGWIIVGTIKMLAGSFLAVLALKHGINSIDATDPTQMYMVAFGYITQSPQVALGIAGVFVVLCQLKINVTNAYAGSIAWSNFFSRLTHSHPGRVVWLIFNVGIALLLMELGVYQALEQTLGFYAIVAVAWLGSLVADLTINKPLGLSPKHIEFKRAHLYDINPVGCGAMVLACIVGMLCYANNAGETAKALAHFITLITALIAAPMIAWITKGRYYIARPFIATDVNYYDNTQSTAICCICELNLEKEDISYCPAYAGNICSLCCSLDARCGDYCKPGAGYWIQAKNFIQKFLPASLTPTINSRIGHFFGLLTVINGFSGLLLSLIYFQSPTPITALTLWKVFFLLVIITGIVIWLAVLAHESRVVAQEESQRQTRLLTEEIIAHEQTDRELQRAKEAAEAANNAKSRYLAGISHELRSPLNAVLGYAQLLEKDPNIPPNRRNAISVIRRSGEHLGDLIEGLLDISKIEAGRLDLHIEQVRLPQLIDQLVHMFRLQAEAKGLKFDYIQQTALPEFVKTDEKRLRQILINMLSNAVKYTQKGEIIFNIRYRSQVAEFSVTDTGVGISEDNIERIFQPFERVKTPGSSVTGTGLGLTISKLLSDIMGGDLSLTSTVGKGTQFRLALMLSSTNSPSQLPQPDRQIFGYAEPRKTLMVVDDEASHRQLIEAALTPLGFRVELVDNSLMAVDSAHNIQPDLIMLDISMPGLNGWQIAEQLRNSGLTCPIIMVSADARETHTDTIDKSHHNAYVVKPINIHNLLETIGEQLNLNWQYHPVHDQNVANQETVIEHSPVLLDEATREKIKDLAIIGHKGGIIQLLNNLMAQGKCSRVFYDQAVEMANNFQFESLISMLKATENE
ncbi:response regulator [Gilvimarinus agarilyticus]|uniref:hybrid sensor histidine kinase/response regulator n=1 Tax=Gilvimarinus sp. 2_MG-2023 TaxID=3062666 RepID=UPI001C09B3F1|nr:ATP-binding protein [Gilvimarinus sp. 2_MG-2023]MBU2886929.1 response regulator [Gilvimarinus agarilyticus]MDO6571589.1 ATP-binding protein [Gilvimarinus sp. 2_MG-2023]